MSKNLTEGLHFYNTGEIINKKTVKKEEVKQNNVESETLYIQQTHMN